jgi:hypothetical protein
LVREVSCSRRGVLVAGPRASRMCCIRSAVGPGAESSGKLLRTLDTASGESSSAAGRLARFGHRGAGAGGWRLRSSMVVSRLSGRIPQLSRAEQALRSKPSRQSASALRLTSSGLSCFGRLRLWLLVASSQRVVLSPVSQHDRRSSVKAAA